MENPIRMDDLGVPPFKETPIWILWVKESPPKEEAPWKGKKKHTEQIHGDDAFPWNDEAVDALKIW